MSKLTQTGTTPFHRLGELLFGRKSKPLEQESHRTASPKLLREEEAAGLRESLDAIEGKPAEPPAHPEHEALMRTEKIGQSLAASGITVKIFQAQTEPRGEISFTGVSPKEMEAMAQALLDDLTGARTPAETKPAASQTQPAATAAAPSRGAPTAAPTPQSQSAPAPVAPAAPEPQGRRSFDELYRQVIDVVRDDYRYAMAEKGQTDLLRSEAGRFANALLKGQFTSLEVARAEFKKYAEEFLVELTSSGLDAWRSPSEALDSRSAPVPPTIADDDPRIMQIYGHIEPFRDQLLKIYLYSWVIEEIKSGLVSGKSLGDIVRGLKAAVEDRERYVRQVISDELSQAGELANVDQETIDRIAVHLDVQDDTIRSMVRSAIEQTPTVEAQPTPTVVSEPPRKPGFLRTAEDMLHAKE